MAEIVLSKGATQLLRLPVEKDLVTIGRGEGNDLILPDVLLGERVNTLRFSELGRWEVWAPIEGQGWRALAGGDRFELGGDWSASLLLGEPTSPGERRRAPTAGLTQHKQLSASAPQGLSLVLLGGGSWSLDQDELSLGSDPANLLCLDDPYVSSFHARLRRRGGAWWIVDQGSTNGSFVDGVRVSEAEVSAGSLLQLGDSQLRLEGAPEAPRGGFGVVTRDPGMLSVLSQIRRVAPSDVTVTIYGESGTGKELISAAVHLASDRADGPFVPINCAAISSELIESELFGHEKGAFTGAHGARRGAFEEASGGTLFLDEIGELPLDLQAKLLRALESREVRRVGSSRPIKVNTRFVAATNRDLHLEVQAGRFREDLFYRLFVVPITLPPLRQRPSDVLLLAEHFIRSRALTQLPPKLSPGAAQKLEAHSWPGNVRELKNTLDRAILLREGALIEAEDIVFPQLGAAAAANGPGIVDVAGKKLKEVEREAIRVHLHLNKGNRRATAESLGLARSTLHVKLREYGLVEELG